MSVLVDTTIWSLAIRRRAADLSDEEAKLVAAWSMLVRNGGAVLIGPIRQELLSGVRDPKTFLRLRRALGGFRHAMIRQRDYDDAAALYNKSRARGIAATSIDMLICAVALRLNVPLFTTDRDFPRYSPWTGLRIFEADKA